jgi:hypothetical protein
VNLASMEVGRGVEPADGSCRSFPNSDWLKPPATLQPLQVYNQVLLFGWKPLQVVVTGVAIFAVKFTVERRSSLQDD